MKSILVAVSIAFMVLFIFLGTIYPEVDTSYLRIHIRANSNAEVDQIIKYKIKDSIIEAITPDIVLCNSFDEVKNCLVKNLDKIDSIANSILMANGFNYTAKSEVSSEEFPTRSYGEYVLEHGIYDALIVNLGQAKGDNWWCVVYPPLCFTSNGSGNNIVYKSRIVEMIKNWSK